jgi:hypothetical protein
VMGTVVSPGGDSGAGWSVDISLNTQDGAPTQNWLPLNSSYYFPGVHYNLATLDPTTLLNGTYTIRVTATDTYGQTSSATSTFVVGKNAKPGDFTLTFTDLNIPLAGLPIAITRSYDSRDHEIHDFGQGWSMGIANARVEKNRVLGKSWTETQTHGVYFDSFCLGSNGDRNVTITFPDGKQYIFQAVSVPQ